MALTFDDGPSPTVTPPMVRLLTRLHVPATFFMVGTNVAAHPELARLVSKAGFTIGSHTWEHSDLTKLTDRGIRRSLQRTRHALVTAGAPAPTLVRPPYGAIDDRVRRVLAERGDVPVLWTIDPRDWEDGTPRQIADRVITATHPHRTNVVIQHDGVTRSPLTLQALSREIALLRERGYCFAPLGPDGQPVPPVPVATVTADRGEVTEGGRVRLTVRLDQPTTRATTVRTSAGSVHLPAGQQSATLWLRAPDDRVDESAEVITAEVYAGSGVRAPQAPQGQARVRVVDDDPAPVARLLPASVTASPILGTAASIGVRLDRAADRAVRVVVRSPLGRASALVPAGAQEATVTLTVPVGAPGDGDREVWVRPTTVVHATPGPATTLVVHAPEETAAQALRAVVAAIRWPVVAMPAVF